MLRNKKLNFLINIAFYTTIVVLTYLVVKFLLIYLFPFLIGLIVTIAVQSPAKYFSEKISVKKGNCALLFVVISYLILSAIIVAIIYYSGSCLSTIVTNANGITDNISAQINSAIEIVNEITNKLPKIIKDILPETSGTVASELTSFISQIAKSAASATPMFITSTVVTIIASCYIAKDYDRFKDSLNSVLPPKYKAAAREIKALFHEKIVKLFWGYGKLLGITFGELLVGLLLLGTPNPILIAAIISMLDLLPVLGTGTILIPWAILNLINRKYYLAAGLTILYIIIVIVRNALEPKIIGKQIGLHPLIALICVFIGLKIFGFIGIILVPLAVMLFYNMFERGVFKIIFSNDS